MMSENTIPLVIGVTGHRAIRPEDRSALYCAVKEELNKLKALCPSSPFVMLSSLAEGADLLCADAAAELDIPLIAVLPRPREDYERDFSEEGLARFAIHAQRAQDLFVAPRTEELPEHGASRSDLFRQAGIYVASHSHVLLALWDGGDGSPAACGTAEAVDFALRGSYQPENGLALRSENNEGVIHVFTPRGERQGETAGTVHLLGNWDAVRELLRRTDAFNRLAAALPEKTRRLLPEPRPEDAALERMEQVYLAASALSSAAAKRYRTVLAALAIASTVLTMAFLLYDEAHAIWMIFVCGAMLLAAWGCRRFARRSDCHRQYLEFRALAESLRVQAYLRYAGSALQSAELFSWTQQEETAWILVSLCALGIGLPLAQGHDIKSCWVEQQREYHEWAGQRANRELSVSERVVRTALLLSVAFYLAAVVFELVSGGELRAALVPVGDAEWYRTLLKLVMGSLSAATLFVSNYYGRLSLSRKCSDHTKMAHFYRKLSALLVERGQTEELLTVLAREELIENGNWLSYQRDNTPDINL